MKIERILKVAVRGGASDIILKPNALPRFRFNGELLNLADGEVVSDEMMNHWLDVMVPERLKDRLSLLEDLDFSYTSQEGFRFRVNLFRQRQKFGLVLRVVQNHTKTLEELQLPQVMRSFAQEKRGLILVTGATGSGKSTTLAAIIEKINQTRAAHIVTIEDPVEFLFRERKATINQRELGIDTSSFSDALRSALRQNPDVIFVGELRDKETTETALMAAETGHLVLSTLHTMDAPESLTRLLGYFPPHQSKSLRLLLSQTLRYVVSQRLIPRSDKKGLVPAIEILAVNELVKDQIQKGEDLNILRDSIKNGRETYGMQSFDQSLLELVERGIIDEKTAKAYATNAKDLSLALAGVNH